MLKVNAAVGNPVEIPAAVRRGAVGRDELALDRLSEGAVAELGEASAAAMAGSLLRVRHSDRDPQSVVNSGTLY